MDPRVNYPSRMSARRIREGPDGLHQTMLDVSELACFRLDRYLKRHRLGVLPFVDQWTRPSQSSESCDDPSSVVAETFRDSLPREIVKDKIWPFLMDGQTAVDNFRVLCHVRCVCLGWMVYAEDSREWHLGFEAWKQGDHRFRSETGENPFFDTDSESDPDWGYEHLHDDKSAETSSDDD